MPRPYMVSTTTAFSDGTETVINYVPNQDAEVIETEAADEIAAHSEEETPDAESPTSGTEETVDFDQSTVGGTE